MENIPSNIKNFPLLNDVIFKRVFTKKEKSGILEDFLSSILNVKIKRAIVKNAEIPKDALKEKLSVLDIRAETDNNRIVDVEMQVKNKYNTKQRGVYYMSKNIATQLLVGEKYQDIKPSVIILILNYNLYKVNSYHEIAHMKLDKTEDENYINLGYTEEEEEATDMLEMHVIELPKYRKKKDKTYTKKEQWLSLIAGGKEKKMARLDEPKVKEALKLVEEVLADSKERDLYESRKLAQDDRYCVRKHGIEEGKNRDRRKIIKRLRKHGIEDGKNRERRKIIKRLRKHGMSNKEISKMMEINLKKIKKVI